MVRFYVAGKFQTLDRLREFSLQFQGRYPGTVCTARWLEQQYPEHETAEERNSRVIAAAQMDLRDVGCCDIFIKFSDELFDLDFTKGLYEESSRVAGKISAGRFVELGYALALRKHIILIGPTNGIFEHPGAFSEMTHFDDVPQLITYMDTVLTERSFARVANKWGFTDETKRVNRHQEVRI